MKISLIALALGFVFSLSAMANFTFRSHKNISVAVNPHENQVVFTALELLGADYAAVFDGSLNTTDGKASVYVGTVGMNAKAETWVDKKDLAELRLHEEAFLVTEKKGNLIVLGSDKRGTAYGILELSRLMGVSPWVWWADSPIEKKNSLTLKKGFRTLQYPSVARRGIFINDEDWGLTPWSYQTYEPSAVKGQIGPKTHARIFELLLRLRANTFWPAMHDCSVAFYLTPGNKQMADKYGIYIGTSHCEPMVRNTNAEWKNHGVGEYNYLTNRDNILRFWDERVTELSGSDNIYTLGIRGVHDGAMLGAKTLQEQKAALDQIIKDQRDMIARLVNPDVQKVSQVFIPYKEVLDVYKMGLQVPDDVTLMWTDDNYGYIKHFPTANERARKGGNGVYYHVSYWGRPHDYLWLATTHPAQVYGQMKLAYDKGARAMWILNVGDIKPAEYLIELFMDMAWDIRSIENGAQGLDNHLHHWLAREFGNDHADALCAVMDEYYRLAYIRKPDFMGNTRTEETDPKYKAVSDLPWGESTIRQRIADYESISKQITDLSAKMPASKQASWFQLVEYPVRGAAEMNRKHLYGQLARHGKVAWPLSDAAYDTIVWLTEKYNRLNHGKWNNMMDYRPRNLAVFDKVPHTAVETPLVDEGVPLGMVNGRDYVGYNGEQPVANGLGYQRGAVSLAKGSEVSYGFEVGTADSVRVEVALAPNHPVDGETIRYAVSVKDEPAQTVDYHTEGRSEEWKLNVLRNQAIGATYHRVPAGGHLKLTIVAIDEGVVVDQIKVWAKK